MQSRRGNPGHPARSETGSAAYNLIHIGCPQASPVNDNKQPSLLFVCDMSPAAQWSGWEAAGAAYIRGPERERWKGKDSI